MEGVMETLRARAVICAVGQLNQPYTPEIAGADSFAGPAFHTARWDHDVDLTGKDVGDDRRRRDRLPGRPAIAETVARLTIFQRTAQWMFQPQLPRRRPTRNAFGR